MGWFVGNIDVIRQDSDDKIYDILFKDGDSEEQFQKKYYTNAANACIPIGDTGFRFINNFSDGYFFSGRVLGIQYIYKSKCNFNQYGDINNYTLNQLQTHSTKHIAVYNNNDEKGVSNNGRDDNDEVTVDNDANKPSEKEQEEDSGVDSDTEVVVPHNGRCFKKSLQIGPGQSIQDRIINMKSRKTSHDAFSAMLSNPNQLTEGRFEKLELNGLPVQVVPYPTVAKISEI